MTIYTVRAQSHSDDPAEAGQALQKFKTWEEAKAYRDALWTEDGIKSYLSKEVS